MTEKSVQVMDDETLVIQGNKIFSTTIYLPHISKLTSDEIKMLGGKDGLRKTTRVLCIQKQKIVGLGYLVQNDAARRFIKTCKNSC